MRTVVLVVLTILITYVADTCQGDASKLDTIRIGVYQSSNGPRAALWKQLQGQLGESELVVLDGREVRSLGDWNVDSDNVGQLRKVAKVCDVALLLEQGKDGRPVGCSIRDTRNAALLVESTIQSDSSATPTMQLARLTKEAMTRRPATGKSPTRIRLTIASNESAGPEWLRRDSLAGILERRLVATSDVVVLPRQFKSEVDRTNTQADGRADVEVVLATEEIAGNQVLSGRMQSRDGAEDEFQLFVESIPSAVIEITDAILKLAGTPAATDDSDSSAEVQRYGEDSAFRAGKGEWEAAIRAAETTALLSSDDVQFSLKLLDVMLGSLNDDKTRHRESALKWTPDETRRLIERAFKLARSIGENASATNVREMMLLNEFGVSSVRLSRLRALLSDTSLSLSEDRLAVFREDYGVFLVRPLQVQREAAMRDSGVVNTYTNGVWRHMTRLLRVQIGDGKVGQPALDAAMGWLDAVERHSPRNPWSMLDPVMRDLTLFVGAEQHALLEPLYNRLEDSYVPLVRLYGMRGRLTPVRPQNDAESDALALALVPFREAAIEALLAGLKQPRSTARLTVDLLCKTYDRMVFRASPGMMQEIFQVSEELLKHRVVPPAFWSRHANHAACARWSRQVVDTNCLVTWSSCWRPAGR